MCLKIDQKLTEEISKHETLEGYKVYACNGKVLRGTYQNWNQVEAPGVLTAQIRTPALDEHGDLIRDEHGGQKYLLEPVKADDFASEAITTFLSHGIHTFIDKNDALIERRWHEENGSRLCYEPSSSPYEFVVVKVTGKGVHLRGAGIFANLWQAMCFSEITLSPEDFADAMSQYGKLLI